MSRIKYRSVIWEKCVNQVTNTIIQQIFSLSPDVTHLNINLNLNTTTNSTKLYTNIPSFQFKPSQNKIDDFLSYLISWPGLNMKLILNTNRPTSQQEYYLKARNWANGCRPKEHSQGYVPFMVNMAEQYAIMLSNHLFKYTNHAHSPHTNHHCDNDTNTIKQELNEIFTKLLIYSYLVKLLTTRVTVVHGNRKVNLVSDNCMKTARARGGNKFNCLLRGFAQEHPYVNNFPSHRDEAIGYFEVARNKQVYRIMCTFQRLRMSVLLRKLQRGDSNSKLSKHMIIYQLMQYIAKANNNLNSSEILLKWNTKAKNSQRFKVIIDKRVWEFMRNGLHGLEQVINRNKTKINQLRSCLNINKPQTGMKGTVHRMRKKQQQDDNEGSTSENSGISVQIKVESMDEDRDGDRNRDRDETRISPFDSLPSLNIKTYQRHLNIQNPHQNQSKSVTVNTQSPKQHKSNKPLQHSITTQSQQNQNSVGHVMIQNNININNVQTADYSRNLQMSNMIPNMDMNMLMNGGNENMAGYMFLMGYLAALNGSNMNNMANMNCNNMSSSNNIQNSNVMDALLNTTSMDQCEGLLNISNKSVIAKDRKMESSMIKNEVNRNIKYEVVETTSNILGIPNSGYMASRKHTNTASNSRYSPTQQSIA